MAGKLSKVPFTHINKPNLTTFLDTKTIYTPALSQDR